jgi:hypothetical protein
MTEEATQTTQSITPTTGVVLLAFGKPQYYWAAYNLAFSIRKHNPNVSITAYFENKEKALSYCPDLVNYIDTIGDIDINHIYTNKKLDPLKVKINLYGYLPYERNLYLDVDAVALKDIQPLIDEYIQSGKEYISHTVGYHTIDKGRDFKEMQWAWADKLWAHFELKQDTVVPAINSSIQWIIKGAKAESIFKEAIYLYYEKTMPLNELRMKWGGGQPDELYMNVALAKLGIDPALKHYEPIKGSEGGVIHFSMHRGQTYEEVTSNYYFQSYYGGKGFTPTFYINWLDRMLNADHKAIGKRHNFLISRITEHKFADGKR